MASEGTIDADASIDRARNPGVKAEGKVAVVAGATGGLGFAIARAFVAAGAKGIVVVGRNSEKLKSVAHDLDAGSRGLPIAADSIVQDEVDAMFCQARDHYGRVDFLINAAGTMNVGPIGTLSSSDWWQNFEVNLGGVYNMCHGFIRATGGQGTIVNLVSLGASFLMPGMSGYSASQLALIKLGESLDLEQPNLRVFSVHPGMVEAENGRGMVVESLLPFSKDKAGLTGALAVYLTTDKADFLRGGYIHANWDVEELEAHKDEIVEKKLIKLGFINGKMQAGGYPWSI
ncbi:hypothetical protein Daus18300_003815 [Diaporthe australafricana]|uniref:Ketoreductase domain-containing protein n=1 Tax=Diaporthe australafricana TaxID=127596 RepID=A0ABR3XE44_9PEZI